MTVVSRIVAPIELISAVAALAGVALKYLHLPGADEIIMVSMSSLSAALYLRAFLKPTAIDETGAPKSGFSALLGTSLIPKTSWIACSVVVISAQFALLHLNAAREMAMIGTYVLTVSCLSIIYYVMTNSVFAPDLKPILYRGVPLCFIGWYLLMNLAPGTR
ncbi:MAG TPA: hypothetical protein VFE50_17505 [Cyclobacteriaceae bacterium]|nr:hypothetical protein [Cyclobacteriaceae bacterium]